MKDLITVIVPVYNVEKYLNRCVDSILAQSYTNLEVILVDDGSPDSCPAICDEYAKKDKRVKVIHKPNGGQGTARNAGIDIAKGKYIAFVDSDDWVEKDFINILYNSAIDYDADLLICNYNEVNEDGQIIRHSNLQNDKYESNKFDLLFKRVDTVPIIVPWNKLYKRTVFNNLRYANVRIYEDEGIAYQLIKNCKKIVIIDDVLNNYVIRSGSTMDASKVNKRMLGIIDIMEERMNCVQNTQYEQYATKMFLYSMFLTYMRVYSNKELRTAVYKIFLDNYYFVKKIKFSDRVKFRIFKLCPNIVARLKMRKL